VIEPDTTQLKPGFYDIKVDINYTTNHVAQAITTFGWNVDDEEIIQVVPADFDSYWDAALAKIAATPIDLKVTSTFTLKGAEIDRYNIEQADLPEHYDPDGERYQEVEVSKINFASPVGGRVYAWLAKPVGVGPFPGLLVLPGAGNAARPAPVEHARHGYIAIDVQVHGNDVDCEEYTPPGEPEYLTPDTYGHAHVYRNALQAINALVAFPGVDPSRLAVAGGSQGGRLSFVTSSLDPRIKAAVPAIPHYCYRPWLRWTEVLNLEGRDGAEGFTRADVVDDERTRVESYYDVINFVGRMKGKVFANAGLVDAVSPPTGAYAAYRLAAGVKEFTAIPNFAHDWFSSFDRRAWRWLDEVLGLK
jgi:cephalosporin-C deacetylase-like acetyl esterase